MIIRRSQSCSLYSAIPSAFFNLVSVLLTLVSHSESSTHSAHSPPASAASPPLSPAHTSFHTASASPHPARHTRAHHRTCPRRQHRHAHRACVSCDASRSSSCESASAGARRWWLGAGWALVRLTAGSAGVDARRSRTSGGGACRASSAGREVKAGGATARRSNIGAARGVAVKMGSCRAKQVVMSSTLVAGVVVELAGRRLGVGSAGRGWRRGWWGMVVVVVVVGIVPVEGWAMRTERDACSPDGLGRRMTLCVQ
jgi:hypothetical protein